jgi:hypothetical protein
MTSLEAVYTLAVQLHPVRERERKCNACGK